MEGQSAIIAPGRGVVSRRRDQALVKSAASLHAGHKPHRILHGAQPAKLAGRRTVERATSPPTMNRSIRWGPHHRPPCEECFRKASPSETPSRAGRWPLHRIPFLSEHRTIHEVAMPTTSSSGQERMARTGPSAANRSELVGSSTPPGRSTPGPLPPISSDRAWQRSQPAISVSVPPPASGHVEVAAHAFPR